MTLNPRNRSIFALGIAAMMLVPFAPAGAQLAPPQPLAGPPIIIGQDQDFEIAASRRSTKMWGPAVECRGGSVARMAAQLTDRKTGAPLANQTVYVSISSRGHEDTGFSNGQFIREVRTDSAGVAAVSIQTRRTKKTRTVRVEFAFQGTDVYRPSRDIISLKIRP